MSASHGDRGRTSQVIRDGKHSSRYEGSCTRDEDHPWFNHCCLAPHFTQKFAVALRRAPQAVQNLVSPVAGADGIVIAPHPDVGMGAGRRFLR